GILAGRTDVRGDHFACLLGDLRQPGPGRRLRWQLRIGLVDPFAEIRDPRGDAAHGVHVSSLPHASATQELPGPAMLTEREHDARHISPGHECASPCPRSPPPSWARGYLTGPTSPGDGPRTGGFAAAEASTQGAPLSTLHRIVASEAPAMDTTVFQQHESEIRGHGRAPPARVAPASTARQAAEDGTSCIHFFAGAGVLNFGHNNPRMKEALVEFIQADGVAHSLDTYTTTKRDFLSKFHEKVLAPRGMSHRMQFMG